VRRQLHTELPLRRWKAHIKGGKMASIRPVTSGSVQRATGIPRRERLTEGSWLIKFVGAMDERSVPKGFRGLRGDLAHYCQLEGARGALGCLLMAMRTPSIWALAVYRFGRWLRFGHHRIPGLKFLFGPIHVLLSELVRHLTGILINPWTEIEDHVWLESFTPMLVGAKRVGKGTRIYGGVTLGAGGPRNARGLPTIGNDVVLAPGAIVTGPIRIPDHTVVGPNTVISLSPPGSGAWLGVPAAPWKGPPEALIPAQPSRL
jgi:serine O-acetyltransferase